MSGQGPWVRLKITFLQDAQYFFFTGDKLLDFSMEFNAVFAFVLKTEWQTSGVGSVNPHSYWPHHTSAAVM